MASSTADRWAARFAPASTVRSRPYILSNLPLARTREEAEVDLYEAMRTLPSVKRYKPDPVSDDDIRTILTAATWAPSGGNAQPWEFIVVRDPDLKKKLADLYREGLKFLWDHPRRQGYREFDKRTFQKTMIRKSHHLRDHLEETPVLIVVAMDRVEFPPLAGHSHNERVSSPTMGLRAGKESCWEGNDREGSSRLSSNGTR